MTNNRFFPWRPEYSIDIPLIDAQHQILIGYIDELYASVEAKKQKEHTIEVVKKLKDYTDFHFGLEEKYFAQYGYIEEASHKAEHVLFVEKIVEFQNIIERNLPATFQILLFLKDWFSNHIMKNDRKYALVLKDKIV